jgi:hypothetical protein
MTTDDWRERERERSQSKKVPKKKREEREGWRNEGQRRREHWTGLGWDLKQLKNGSSVKAHIRVDDIIRSQGLRKMTPKAFGLVPCRFILRQYSCIWLVIYYFGDFDKVFLHTIKFKLEAIFISCI